MKEENKQQAVTIGSTPLHSLATTLEAASKHAAQTSLENYTNSSKYSQIDAAIQAGAAVEWLVRSVIARSNPSILADASHHESLLVFTGVKTASSSDYTALKTINIKVALDILFLIHPQLSVRADVLRVMAIRNSASHIAILKKNDCQEAIRRMVRAVNEILGILSISHLDFWGNELCVVVEQIQRDFEDEISARVASKIASAKVTLKTLLSGLSESQSQQIQLVLAQRKSKTYLDESESEPYICPACANLATLTFFRIPDEDFRIETDFDRHGEVEDAYVVREVSLTPVFLECHVCELFLDGDEDELSLFSDIQEKLSENPEVTSASEWFENQDYYE